jgi:hypothetical protein
MRSMFKGKARLSWVVATVLFLPCLVHADSTIYSNLNSNPANLFASGTPGISNTIISGFNQSVAASFISSGNFQVTQLDLAIQFFDNGCCNTPEFNISLVTDSAGLPSTTTLFAPNNFSYLPPTTLNPGGDCCPLLTINVGPGVNLLAGQTYWLVGAPVNGASTDLWQFNSTGATTSWALNTSFVLQGNDATVPDPSTWAAQRGANPAFAVLGTSVTAPEPSTLISLLAGFVLLSVVLAKRT